MTPDPDYSTVLRRVLAWPIDARIALARDLLSTIRSEVAKQRGTRNTVSRALGLAKGKGAVPSDEEVRRWIDEHRMEKYGG